MSEPTKHVYDWINDPLPKNHPNWLGKPARIMWPKKAKLLARCGDVYLLQQTKKLYAVVYGLETNELLTRDCATHMFGNCCVHQAECHSLTIE